VAKNTILIVDDDPTMLILMADVLMAANSQLLSARSAVEALAKLEASPIDLVISDQNMPGMSGLQFLETVREKYPEVITMLLTASSERMIAVEAVDKGGVYRVIFKPFNIDDLRLSVQRALEYKQLLEERNHLLEVVASFEPLMDGGIRGELCEMQGRLLPEPPISP
jgi:DNA-binding NtrC family response regulator